MKTITPDPNFAPMRYSAKEEVEARRSAAACSPSSVRFNMNHYVRVKITPHGKKCLRKNHDDLAKSYGGKLGFPLRLPKTDKDGWTRFQMHDLMATFGKHMYFGCQVPFETEIEILLENSQAQPPKVG
jgi:hypothetical protein